MFIEILARASATRASATTGLAFLVCFAAAGGNSLAQQATPQADAPADSAADARIAQLTDLVQRLESRVANLEARLDGKEQPSPAARDIGSAPSTPTTAKAAARQAAQPAAPPATTPLTPAAAPQSDQSLLRGTTVNILLDGYYGYNFNNPIGRVNYLRTFDVSSNAFSLSQADLVLENAPDLAAGKRYGLRLDLQYGQATATLQGNASNEPRPDLYRNIFQAYGTYVLPVGGGLTVDFGKWASSLGIEGNYTKDQINYSRSFWFDFLPFYHMGARVNYKVNNALSLNYWITNGTQQTEPFNGFKDQLFGFNLQPNKNVAWTANYYLGQEHPDFQYVTGSTPPGLPEQQGNPFIPIVHPLNGKLNIFDSYVTWNLTPSLTLAADGDYVIEREYTNSAPSHADGGALYARYQFGARLAIAGRTEYLSDRGGLFTGVTQAIKETTFTFEQKIADGFLLREEWRRDASNHPYFLTNTLGVLKKEQNTATLGVVWWFGAKEGVW